MTAKCVRLEPSKSNTAVYKQLKLHTILTGDERIPNVVSYTLMGCRRRNDHGHATPL